MEWQKRAYETYYKNYLFLERGQFSKKDAKKKFKVWNKHYLNFLPKDKNANILDIGCGIGEIVFWLSELGYQNVIGVDTDKNQIEVSKNLVIGKIFLADFRDFLKDKLNSYECIIARDVIEHFRKEDIFEVLDILYKALKPDGVLIIQTPNAESPFGSRYRYYDFTHCLSFTPTSINHVLRTVGFNNVILRPLRPTIYGLKSFLRYILWRAIESLISFYFLVETGHGRGIFTLNMLVVAHKK